MKILPPSAAIKSRPSLWQVMVIARGLGMLGFPQHLYLIYIYNFKQFLKTLVTSANALFDHSGFIQPKGHLKVRVDLEAKKPLRSFRDRKDFVCEGKKVETLSKRKSAVVFRVLLFV